MYINDAFKVSLLYNETIINNKGNSLLLKQLKFQRS